MISLDFSQEWRTFGVNNNGTGQDQSRCHRHTAKKQHVKDIFDNRNIQLSQALIDTVEARFNKVLENNQNKVVRGEGRAAIVGFACTVVID